MKTHRQIVPLLAALVLAPAASATTIAYSRTFLNTDFASAGYGGMRGGDGTGELTLSGVSGTVKHALLYWHGPQLRANSNASVLFNGNAIQGVSIGLAGENCWSGFAHSQAYRADVTSFVTGSGSFSLEGFIKPGLADINGVSLLVSFDDGNGTNNRDIILFEGNDSNLGMGSDDDGWQADLGSLQYSGSGDVLLELGVADGQYAHDGEVMLNGRTLVPGGPVFEGDSVPRGSTAGDTNGGLWDLKRYEFDSLLTPGLNTLELTSYLEDDCLSLVQVVVNSPAGSSPLPPPDRVPDGGSTLFLLVLSTGLARAVFGGRRTA
jgi:hypothetical protein